MTPQSCPALRQELCHPPSVSHWIDSLLPKEGIASQVFPRKEEVILYREGHSCES